MSSCADYKSWETRDEIRTAVADYIHSEGCSCCEGPDHKEIDLARLAKLLKVRKYKDCSGYNFEPYRTKK